MAMTNNEGAPPADPGAGKTALNEGAPAPDPGKTALNQDPPAEGEVGSPDPNAEGEGEGGKPKDKPEGAPETYEAFTLPEGVEADETQLTAFSEVAKELNLSQEAAQKLVDFEVARVKEQQESAAKFWNDQTAEWLANSKADQEIGGKGWNDTLKYANVFVAQFGNDGLREVMEMVGLGNHPEVLRAFARAGRAMSEDEFVKGRGGANNEPRTRADILYGNNT